MAKATSKAAKPAVEEDVLSDPALVEPQVLGYKPQHPDTIAMVNDHKIWEEQLRRRFDWLFKQQSVNQRHLNIAAAHFDIAFALLNMAVFNPGRLELTEEMSGGFNLED